MEIIKKKLSESCPFFRKSANALKKFGITVIRTIGCITPILL